MNSYADPNIEGWFAIRGLPWSKETAMKLREQGAECVDDLKFLDRDVVNSLFKDEKPVVKAKAKAAWKDLEVNNEQAIRDIESQGEQLPASTVPEVCITAGISVFLSILGLVFGIVSCAKAAEAYDCSHSYSYNYYYNEDYYYNEYGWRYEQRQEYGCDRDTARKALDVARGMALTSAIFYAIATPLAFYAGRAYLPSKTREGIQTNRACPNPRCCPFNMAVSMCRDFAPAFYNLVNEYFNTTHTLTSCIVGYFILEHWHGRSVSLFSYMWKTIVIILHTMVDFILVP